MQQFKVFIPALLIFGMLGFFTSCEKEAVLEPTQVDNALQSVDLRTHCDAVIDFEPLERGAIVESLSSGSGVSGVVVTGAISVYGENIDPARPDVNHAMIFDTDDPSGSDDDLVVPGRDYHKILIISEDLDSSDPDDDNVPGGIFTFDFSGFGSGLVDVAEFIAIDTEEGGSWAAYDENGVLIASGTINEIPNGTDQLVTVGATGVEVFVVTFNGSGGIDNICINIEEEEEEGCTLTIGYWKNTKKGPWPAPYDRNDEFFLSGKTWQQVLTSSVANNAYYQAAHQYIGAVLNVANGASSPMEVDAAIAAAEVLFATYTPADIAGLSGSDPLRQQFIAISETLDSYNMGLIGPGHCDD